MPDIEDDNFQAFHANSICFKGDPDKGGHWVYVDKKLIAHSTYEDNLIKLEDDGVCHGATMINAFESTNPRFKLVPNLKNKNQNYRSILEFYIYLITSGKWDSALENNFYGDVHWIKGTYNGRIVDTTVETMLSYNLLLKQLQKF